MTISATERVRRWRLANPGKKQEHDRRYREADPEKVRQQKRRYQADNKEEIRRRRQQRYLSAQDAVLDHYGRACTCCGSTESLSVDHINGGGKAHRVELFGQDDASQAMYLWLIEQGFPDGYQTLCRPCNSSKYTGSACCLYHGPDPELKACTCRDHEGPNPLPLSEFGKHRKNKDGLRAWCRTCCRTADRNRAPRIRKGVAVGDGYAAAKAAWKAAG